MSPLRALAIDPGTRKSGIAVVQNGAPPEILYREVVPTPYFAEAFSRVTAGFEVDIVLIGNATNGAALEAVVRPLLPPSFPVQFVEEKFTSEEARARWCRQNPPKSLWERLLPGFRTPDEPVDDYAAAILAERYFAAQS